MTTDTQRTTTMDTAKILANLCDKDSRPNLRAPMRFEVASEFYAAATNGHALVAFRGVEVPAPPSQLSATQVFELTAPDALGVSVTVTMAYLRLTAGVHVIGDKLPCDKCGGSKVEKQKCTRCKGRGTVECEFGDCGDHHQKDCKTCHGQGTLDGCGKCDGDGTVDCPPGTVWINSRWFNKRLLAAVVRDMPDAGSVTLSLSGDMLHVFGDGWAAVIMAMHETQKELPAAPWPFPCEPTGDVTEWQRWLSVRRAVEAGA